MTKTQRYTVPLAFVIIASFASYLLYHYRFRLPEIPIPEDSRAQAPLRTIAVELPDGTRIAAEVAWTDKQKQKGLMFRTLVPRQTGFLMVHKSEDYHQIWMKNTLIDLDVFFVNSDKKIIKVAKNVPHQKKGISEEDVARRTARCKYILEMAAGEADRLKMSKGTLLKFDI